MTLVDKFKKDTVLKEVPPVPDAKGEITKVQVLEEGKIFDPDEFLDQLEQHQPQGPRCLVTMKYGIRSCPDGRTFEYYRCLSARFYTKCYATCGVHEVGAYLKRVKEQTHPCCNTIEPARFRCDCNKSLVLATSHSVNNPTRLYLKCPKRICEFFQWINKPPRDMAKRILIDRERR